MSPDGLPCRKCGQLTGNRVVIYGPDWAGALVPRAVQCRGRCSPARTRQAPRPARPAKRVVVTAFRPGKCATCTWDIVPGDQIVHFSDTRFVHFECSPVEDIPLPEPASSDDGERRRRVRGPGQHL